MNERAINLYKFKQIIKHFGDDWLGCFRYYANIGANMMYDDFMDYGEYLIDIGVLIVDD